MYNITKCNTKLKRTIKRVREEVKATYLIYKKFGFNSAIATLKGKKCNYDINKKKLCETPKDIKCLEQKHMVIERYIYDFYKSYISSYNFEKKESIQTKNMEKTIWICWWQGLDKAPIIVKKCIESITKRTKKYKIIILDELNYKNYVKLPQWIERKKEKGIISTTHFSDIIRFKLLAEHGGIWLDATFFCSSCKIDTLFDLPFWTIKRPGYGHLSPACGYFANYSFGCDYKNRRFFEILSDFLLYYWHENDFIIDYLLTDYIINMLMNHDKKIKKQFEEIKINNKNCDELYKVLNEKYDSSKWQLLSKGTFLFKLSWKHEFNTAIGKNLTFYGKIVNDEL